MPKLSYTCSICLYEGLSIAIFRLRPKSEVICPYKYSEPAPITICSGETCMPRLRARYKLILLRSSKQPVLGERSKISSSKSLITFLIDFEIAEKGKDESSNPFIVAKLFLCKCSVVE